MEDFYKRTDISKEKIELEITIPKKSFEQSYKAVLKDELGKTDLKGFRTGKVPADLLEPQKKDSLKVVTFEKLAPYYLATVLQKENISPVAQPVYKNFPNVLQDKEITFTVEVTIMPEFKLGNMKKIKVDIEKFSVTEKEVDEAIENVFKNHPEGSKSMNDTWAKKIAKKLALPKIDSLESLKKYVKETIGKQKEIVARRNAEDKVFTQAIELSKIEIPQEAIKYEAQEREHSFVHDMGHDEKRIEQFLEATNVTMEKMREMWLIDAENALKSDVFLKTYAKEHEIKIDDKELGKKIEEIKKNAPKDTDQSIFENEQWKEYIRRIGEKEKAYEQFIEEVFGKKK
jgi:FKBP-type peptidyl-prolyl cis-trans isomerase (trigger factor)